MKRLALLGAIALLLGAQPIPGFAQGVQPPAPGPIAESADRIAREWWPTDNPTFTIDDDGRPRFRSGITETVPTPPWQLTPSPNEPPVPVRGAISHQEMLRVMTPQEFSTPALIGASVDPGSIYNDFKKAWRDWQARRIHERVTKEVEALRGAAQSGSDSDSD
jgi:hypothetical protein